MTVDEMNAFIKIKDRHEYFTRDDIFKERNDFEQECLFEIGYLTQIIEKLQKENLLLSAKENMSAYFEFKRNYIPKDKIREIIIEELPDDDICKSCGRYDVNGVVIKQKLIKVLEGE